MDLASSTPRLWAGPGALPSREPPPPSPHAPRSARLAPFCSQRAVQREGGMLRPGGSPQAAPALSPAEAPSSLFPFSSCLLSEAVLSISPWPSGAKA